MNRRLFLSTIFVATCANALPLPYDPDADAKAELRDALAAAKIDHMSVLVIFGANWCEDCRVLDHALDTGPTADLMAHAFKIVKVDVGRFNRNLDVSRTYGDPIRKGIPAAVLLSDSDRVLYATRAGELADARRMSNTGIYDFFKGIADKDIDPERYATGVSACGQEGRLPRHRKPHALLAGAGLQPLLPFQRRASVDEIGLEFVVARGWIGPMCGPMRRRGKNVLRAFTSRTRLRTIGSVAERFKAPVLKTGEGASPP